MTTICQVVTLNMNNNENFENEMDLQELMEHEMEEEVLQGCKGGSEYWLGNYCWATLDVIGSKGLFGLAIGNNIASYGRND